MTESVTVDGETIIVGGTWYSVGKGSPRKVIVVDIKTPNIMFGVHRVVYYDKDRKLPDHVAPWEMFADQFIEHYAPAPPAEETGDFYVKMHGMYVISVPAGFILRYERRTGQACRTKAAAFAVLDSLPQPLREHCKVVQHIDEERPVYTRL